MIAFRMDSENRQYLQPGLWVVATPIGNLQDLSPRAKDALATATEIWCEDTRRTRVLLSALGISTPLKRVDDAHLAPAQVRDTALRLKSVLENSNSGLSNSVALVSDAGTPGISDPGAALVRAARELGIPVTPIPGPSVLAAFWSASGAQSRRLEFHGFAPRKKEEFGAQVVSEKKAENGAFFTFFESPHRLETTLLTLADHAPEAYLVVCKELTKIYERWFSGGAREVTNAVSRELTASGPRGEWVFGFEFPAANEITQTEKKQPEIWEITLESLVTCEVKVSVAVREVSQRFGVNRNLVYERALKFQKKKTGD